MNNTWKVHLGYLLLNGFHLEAIEVLEKHYRVDMKTSDDGNMLIRQARKTVFNYMRNAIELAYKDNESYENTYNKGQ